MIIDNIITNIIRIVKQNKKVESKSKSYYGYNDDRKARRMNMMIIIKIMFFFFLIFLNLIK